MMLSIFKIVFFFNLLFFHDKCASFNVFRHARRAIASMMPLDVKLPNFSNNDHEFDHRPPEFPINNDNAVGYSIINNHSSQLSLGDYIYLTRRNLNLKSEMVLESTVLGHPILPNCNGLSMARNQEDRRLGNIIVLIYLFEPLRIFILNYKNNEPECISTFKALLKNENEQVNTDTGGIILQFWELLALYKSKSDLKSNNNMIELKQQTPDPKIAVIVTSDLKNLFFKHGKNWYSFDGLYSLILFKRQPRLENGEGHPLVMPPPARTNESFDANSLTNSPQNTSMTSPMRRIPSFIDYENEVEEIATASASFDAIITKSPIRGTGNNSAKSSPGTGFNKKKRNHPTHLHENELSQMNRFQEEQSQRKRMMNQDSPGSPLRKKSAKQQNYTIGSVDFTSSWGSRLKKLRPILNKHRRNFDFDAWSREIWQLGNLWLEVSGEEAAGIVYDLVNEFKQEQTQFKRFLIIPKICGNLFLDKLQAKALMLMGKNEQALEICKLALKEEVLEKSTEIDLVKMEIRFIEGCLSRALGKIPGAIEAFEQVLKQDPNHAEALDHLYGFTSGLLPYKARNSEEDVLIQAYQRGNYKIIIDLTLDNLWTRWLGDETVMTLLISSLAANFNSSALYTLGQRSVNHRPNSSISWYCVGLFYQVTGRSDEARRYLFKAGTGSKMNKSGAPDAGIGPAWIALGHSFAAYGDHDQAVSAYVAAVKSHSPGSVDPSLFLAIEYLRVRQPVLSGAYLIDAYNCDSSNPQVLNELACLQAGKENYSAAKKFLIRAVDLAKNSLPTIFQITFALNLSVVMVKEIMNSSSADAEGVKEVLDDCAENILGPFLNTVKKTISSPASASNSNPSVLSLFPWAANSAHPSAEHSFLFVFCVIQEWRALLTNEKASKFTEEALEGYRMLLECRNEHRNLALEAILIERQHRLLTAHSTLSVKSADVYEVPLKPSDESFSANNFKTNCLNSNYKTPRTPLIRSHSLAMFDSFSSSSGSNLSYISSQVGVPQTPILSFSAGALPTVSPLGLGSAASSIAASVSRRRLSLRRQMTGLRFDPADTSASFSSFESDNSFMSTVGIGATVTSTQINEDLMMTASSLIENQSMILMEGTDIEADCELISNEQTITTEPFEYVDEEDMRLDSD